MATGDDFVSEILSYMIQAIRTKSPEELKQFRELKTDVERFKLVWKLPVTHEVVVLEEEYSKKSAEKAKKHRTDGNAFFGKKMYLASLDEYNKSILFAPSKPEQNEDNELAIAYANRSAALCNLKKYRECIDDIELALVHNYPEELRYKLYSRRGECEMNVSEHQKAAQSFQQAFDCLEKANLGESTTEWKNKISKMLDKCSQASSVSRAPRTDNRITPPVLTGTPNSTHPCASSAVQVYFDSLLGRHVKAAQDIRVGEVVTVDQPYAAVLFPKYYPSRCYYCFRQLLVPVPCLNCSTVVYCNATCRSAAWTGYHRYECNYFALLQPSMSAKIGHLAYRLLLITDYSQLISCNPLEPTDGNPPDGTTADTSQHRNSYEEVCRLLTNSSKRSSNSLIDFSVVACLLAEMLNKTGYLEQHGVTCDSSEFYQLGGSLLRHLQVIQCNAQRMIHLDEPEKFADPKPSELGLGVYLTAALYNHSCDPNAAATFFDNTLVLRAIRDIQADEEVCVSYGPVFYEVKTKERLDQLKGVYYFNCRCLACIRHWPTADEMDEVELCYRCERCREPLWIDDHTDKKHVVCRKCHEKHDMEIVVGELQISYDIFAKAMNDSLNGNWEKSLPTFIQHLRLLQKYVCHPWRDLAVCQSAVKNCYRLMANRRL